MEVRLPDGFQYTAGDHLHVLPRNSMRDVRRVLARFSLEEDTVITISGSFSGAGSGTGLPVDTPIAARDLFSGYVELKQTASPKNIRALAESVEPDNSDGARDTLLSLASGDVLRMRIQDRQVSVLDLLERFPSAKPSLASFLAMLVQMRPRTYSFSSAPGWHPGHGTLTYTVVGSGRGSAVPADKMRGVDSGDPVVPGLASSYMSTLTPGEVLDVALHRASAGFRLPADLGTPVIMVAAGTGLAPFRGFLQERAQALQSGDGRRGMPNKMLLFYGCRGEALDSMYASELDSYESQGLVTIHRAYSRQEGADFRYVNDQVSAKMDDIVGLWKQGAVVLVCGGKKMSNSVFDVLGPKLWEADVAGKPRSNAKSVTEWKNHLDKWRYAEEIFL